VKQFANYVIVRTSLVYGLKEVDHALQWLMDGLNAGNKVTLFTDQWRNPIWVQTLSLALIELVKVDYIGILHIVGKQSLNRAQFGVRLLDYFNFQTREGLQFERGDSKRWPPDLRLDNSVAERILQTPLYGVDDVLRRN
jgi:dTDP-4-dehydrorhamnose reductase